MRGFQVRILQRVLSEVADELVTKKLANNKAFQQWAVRSRDMLDDAVDSTAERGDEVEYVVKEESKRVKTMFTNTRNRLKYHAAVLARQLEEKEGKK